MNIIFTNHAKSRIKKRKIAEQDIVDAINKPDSTIKRLGKYYFQKKLERGTIEVCCERERNIKVITVYWR